MYDDFVDVGYDMEDVGIRWPWQKRRSRQPSRGGERGGGGSRGAQRFMRMPVRRQSPIVQKIPGVSPSSIKYVPFGLGFGTIAVGQTTLQLTQQPQVPLKVRKLTVSVSRSGASVAAALVLITAFNIGTVNQFAGLGSVDTAMFIANAEGVGMELSSAGPGINVTLDFLSTVAPLTVDTITVSASYLAETVKS